MAGPARPPEQHTPDERRGRRSKALTVIVGLLVLGLMLRGRQPGSKPVVAADLKELLTEWERDQAATRDKYRGKIIEVVGYLKSEPNYRLKARVWPSPEWGAGKPELSVFVPPELMHKVSFQEGVTRKFRLQLDRPPADLLDKSLPTRAVDILLP